MATDKPNMSLAIETQPEPEQSIKSPSESELKLYKEWTLYAHLPHDTDWTIDSYKPITTISSVQQAIAICEIIPDTMVKNCMLFLMRSGIKPMWEDPKNKNGGCFSYKVSNKQVAKAWKNLCFHLMGETISKDNAVLLNITGATISPKKNFCIIKIWMTDCSIQATTKINTVTCLDKQGVIFKRHNPIY